MARPGTFELGNQLAAKRRVIEGTLQRAIAQDKAERLRTAVERLLDTAAFSEDAAERLAAFNAIADRTDGKAIARTESVDGDVRALTLQDVARLIYQARAADSVDASVAAPSTSEHSLSSTEVSTHPRGDTPVDQG